MEAGLLGHLGPSVLVPRLTAPVEESSDAPVSAPIQLRSTVAALATAPASRKSTAPLTAPVKHHKPSLRD